MSAWGEGGRARLVGGALALTFTAATLSLAPLPPREDLSAEWLAGALLCSAAVWGLRVLRLRLHLSARPQSAHITAATLARVVATHTLLARLAPMKLGELGLPYLLAREGVSVAESAVFLLWARLVELWLLLAGAAASLAWVGAGAGGEGATPLLYSALIALPVALIALTPLTPSALRRLAPLARALAAREGLPAALRASAGALAAALGRGEATPLTAGRVARLAAVTACLLCAQALMFGCFVRACAPLTLSPPALWLGSAGAHLGGVVPLPTLGSVGGHEAGWVAGFTAVGLPLPAAILSAVLSQWVTLAFAGLWWGCARLWGGGR